jgi:hypothetical protein
LIPHHEKKYKKNNVVRNKQQHNLPFFFGVFNGSQITL